MALNGRHKMSGKTEPKPPTILEEAASLIEGDRNDSHGDYVIEAHRIAEMWSVITGYDIAPELVPLMMVGMKVCRASSAGRLNRDDFVDIAGYAALGWRVATREG